MDGKRLATWRTISLLLSTLCLSFPGLSTTEEPPYLLEYERPSNALPNKVNLGCRATSNYILVSNAIFYLGDTIFFDLSLGRSTYRAASIGSRVIFVVDRELEGNYSCGVSVDRLNVIRSPSVQIVVLPDPQLTPSIEPPTSIAKIGSQARIGCPQRPGALYQRYYGNWKNSSSNQILDRIERPSIPGEATAPDSRYNIERYTFTLLINDVMLSDSGLWYQCELLVEDPIDSRSYNFGESENLELLVYESPSITSPPTSTVVSADADTVSFTCVATGSKSPIITWRHRGRNITSDEKYSINFTTFNTNEGGRGSRSTLTFLRLDARDTGLVECLADVAPSPETKMLQLPGDSVSVPFTVLGAFDELIVFITTTKSVIFSLTFPSVPLHPVQLRLIYYDEHGNSLTVIPSTKYTNTREINYIAFSEAVPYNRFRVEISLVQETVIGPGKNTMQTYDKTKPSEIAEIIRAAVIPSVLVPVILGLLIIIPLVICLWYCKTSKSAGRKHRRKKKIENFEMEIKHESCDTINKTIDTLRRQLVQENSEAVKIKILELLESAIKSHFQKNSPSSLQSELTIHCQTQTEFVDGPCNMQEEVTKDLAEKFTDVAKLMLEMGLKNNTIKPMLKGHVNTVMKSCDSM